MREIKFRALKNGKWFSLDFANGGIEWSLELLRKIEEGDTIKFEAFSQYTGLKDRNEKEIYEGDILHIETKDMVNLNYNTAVEWNEKGFWREFTNYDLSEVIGNIYENPSLLNKS